VLVLNRNWQAIKVRTPQDVFCMMTTNEGSVDHVVPRSRGGKAAWENLVWSDLVVSCIVAFTRGGWAARMEG